MTTGRRLERLGSRLSSVRGLVVARHGRIRLYPRCRLTIAPGADLAVDTRLDLGLRYPAGRYYDGHVRLASGARLNATGEFQIYTGCQVWVNEGATLTLGSGYAVPRTSTARRGRRIHLLVCQARPAPLPEVWASSAATVDNRHGADGRRQRVVGRRVVERRY